MHMHTRRDDSHPPARAVSTHTIGSSAMNDQQYMTSSLKRLSNPQGVLTLLGLVTGVAAIFLSFGVTADVNNTPYRIRAWIVEALPPDQRWFASTFLFAPLYFLAAPISTGYLGWLLTGRLPPWAWFAAYALAVLAVAALISPMLLVFGADFISLALGDVASGVHGMLTIFCASALVLGAWLVLRNQQRGVSHSLNALIAMQVVYVVWAFSLSADVITGREGIVPEWGAWFVLLTAALYLAQMIIGSFYGTGRLCVSDHQ